MGALDLTFGATYIGVVFSTFFYGILTLQTYVYWPRYTNDSRFDRYFVLAIWVVDTLQLIFICHMQYWYAIENYANPVALQYNNWSFNMEVGLTAIVTFMVHVFFARRAWTFSSRVENRPVPTMRTRILGILIGITAITQLGFGLACFSMVWVLKKWTEFKDYNWLLSGTLAPAALCDLLITYMLSSVLISQRTGFKRTDALIDKLLRYTVNSGLLTAIFAIVDLATFLTMNNLVHLGFHFVLGKMYSNTLLATLNARDPAPLESGIVHVECGSFQMEKMKSGSKRMVPIAQLQTQTKSRQSGSDKTDAPTTTMELSDIAQLGNDYEFESDSLKKAKRNWGF